MQWICNDKTHTWKPSFSVSNCRIGSEVGRCHLLGSHSMVLLKAKPDISTWNLRSLLLFSFVCHPITWLPLHTGPSSITLFLLWASMPTGQEPKRLNSTEIRKELKGIKRKHSHATEEISRKTSWDPALGQGSGKRFISCSLNSSFTWITKKHHIQNEGRLAYWSCTFLI